MTLHAVQANTACDFAFVTCVLHAAPFLADTGRVPCLACRDAQGSGWKRQKGSLETAAQKRDRAGRLLCPVPVHGVRSECPPVRREHGGSETLACRAVGPFPGLL